MSRFVTGGPFHSKDPWHEVEEFFAMVPAILHADKGCTLTFNRKEAHLFTTWRWMALRVPEGVGQVLWEMDPRSSPYYGKDLRSLMSIPPPSKPPQPRSIIPAVRRMLRLLGTHADFLQRSPEGEILHRARVVHPDMRTEEELDIILIDLKSHDMHLDRYLEHFFHGAPEVRDYMNFAPLVYGGTPRLTPPGARSYERLLRAQRPRRRSKGAS